MSIYIPDIEAPENCYQCWFQTFGWCHFLEDYFYRHGVYDEHDNQISKPDKCPIQEIAEHGSLVDLDRLLKHVHTISDFNDVVDVADILNAETVIPANEN